MSSDFVLSFDIMALAAGSSEFLADGADIFQAGPTSEQFFTLGARAPFTINEVPIPATLGLLGLGLLGLRLRRKA
jgi:hypothetical protein